MMVCHFVFSFNFNQQYDKVNGFFLVCWYKLAAKIAWLCTPMHFGSGQLLTVTDTSQTYLLFRNTFALDLDSNLHDLNETNPN